MIGDRTTDLEVSAEGLISRFNVKGLALPVGAYKHVTGVKRTLGIDLRIAGMLGLDEEGTLVRTLRRIGELEGGSPEVGEDNMETYYEQTRRAIDNMVIAIIGAATHYRKDIDRDKALSYVVDSLALVRDMAYFGDVNRAYEEGGFPFGCRAAFSPAELPLADRGALVEIRANAFLPIQVRAK